MMMQCTTISTKSMQNRKFDRWEDTQVIEFGVVEHAFDVDEHYFVMPRISAPLQLHAEVLSQPRETLVHAGSL